MAEGSSVERPAEAPGRRLDIQGLRAAAVLMVVVYHAGLPLPGGFIGVDVFFVISGFVITALLMRERASHGRIRFGRFYLRRFKRLGPALALTVSCTVLGAVLLLSPLGSQQTAAKTGAGAVLSVANLVIARTTGDYFDAPAETNPLLNTWSLSVEEQFYLAFPLLLALAWRGTYGRRAGRSAQLMVALVAASSFALALVGSSGWRHPSPYVDAVLGALLGFYSPLTRAWEFAAGALLALVAHRLLRLSPRTAHGLGAAGVVLLGSSLWLINGTTPFPGLWTCLPVAGTLLLLIGGAHQGTVVSRGLASAPMVKIGDWSYSIYLWHWPAIVFTKLIWPGNQAAVATAAAMSFLPAYASYRWVEQPIRGLETPTRTRRVVLVVGTVIPGLALSGLLLISANHGFWQPAVQELKAQVEPLHAATLAGCHASGPMTPKAARRCVWNASATGAPIYLVGDSHAEHWSEAVIQGGKDLGRPIVITTGGSCPVVDLVVVRVNSTDDVNRACEDYVDGTTDYLASATPGLVILSAGDAYWTSDSVSVGTTPDTLTADSPAKMSLFRSGLQRTIRSLTKAGHRVVVVQTRPMFIGLGAGDPQSCSLLRITSGEDGCRESIPRVAALERQGPVRDVIAGVVDEAGALVLDPWTELCPGSECDTQRAGLVRYRDGNHATVAQSVALAPIFAEAIEASSP